MEHTFDFLNFIEMETANDCAIIKWTALEEKFQLCSKQGTPLVLRKDPAYLSGKTLSFTTIVHKNSSSTLKCDKHYETIDLDVFSKLINDPLNMESIDYTKQKPEELKKRAVRKSFMAASTFIQETLLYEEDSDEDIARPLKEHKKPLLKVKAHEKSPKKIILKRASSESSWKIL